MYYNFTVLGTSVGYFNYKSTISTKYNLKMYSGKVLAYIPEYLTRRVKIIQNLVLFNFSIR